jgi:hypothetical protein
LIIRQAAESPALQRKTMIGKVKQWLGIEGVKLTLVIPESVDQKAGEVMGWVRFQTMHPQTVLLIRLRMIERYARGRGEQRLVDEYVLGQLEIEQAVSILPDEPVEIPFRLPFVRLKSNVDRLSDMGLMASGLATIARWTRAVKSEYRIEAEAVVKNVGLNPFDKKSILLD